MPGEKGHEPVPMEQELRLVEEARGTQLYTTGVRGGFHVLVCVQHRKVWLCPNRNSARTRRAIHVKDTHA